MAHILELKDLTVSYGIINAVKGISLAVEEGSIVALLGANGAGKSTLLKLLINEIKAKQGSIKIFDKEIAQFREWTKIGYVAQNAIGTNQLPATVEEVVRTNLYSKMRLFEFYKRHHKEEVKLALAKVGMEESINKLVYNLSRGQQQRVSLARVLVNEPILMLLDEPTTGIDVEAAISLYKLLKRMNEEMGITIVMITHDLAQVAKYASRVLCVENRYVYELTEEEVKEAGRLIKETVLRLRTMNRA